jgi:vanillate O-demethylase monooxygenase subunit
MAYLRNTWYAGAFSSELTTAPLGRTLLEEPVVFFRTADGTPAALEDRCPHRFVPLSRGRVCDGELECGYHGLRFDAGGACTRNPHGKKFIPPRTGVRTYPTAERYGFVWFWPGDPAAASPDLLPEIPFLEDPERFAVCAGLQHAESNYQLVIDNLLDLSHVEFLHPSTLGQSEGVERHVTEFAQEGDVVIANRWKRNTLVHGVVKRFFWPDPSERVDARSNMRWSAPARLHFDLGSTALGAAPEDGVCLPQIHLMTPETLTTTHYFWALARNRKLDDATVGEQLYAMITRVFETEDGPMIAAQQRAMGETDDLVGLHPIMLEPDEPAIRARRILARMIAEEQLKTAVAPVPALR